jgi:phosphoesterase RecJ-like protein
VNERGCPRKYAFLSGSEKIRRIEELKEDEREFDVGIVVDGGIERAGAARALFEQCRTRIYIDHHKMGSREKYDLSLSDPSAPSTTQLLWGFFADPEIATPLAKEAAEALYLGLIYDTGSFQYPLTRPSTHIVAARLMESGIDFARIHERALLSQAFEDVLLHAKVLASAERTGKGREIVHAAVPRALAQSPGTTGDGYDRLIQTLCFLEGVDVAVVFRELVDGDWKLSLRARGLVDVASVARALDPDGGGHDRAAGCSLPGPLEAARERALTLIEERVAQAKAACP